MHGEMEGAGNAWRYGGMNEREVYECKDGVMQRWMDAWRDGCTERGVDAWSEGWMHGWIDAWTDGCTERRMHGEVVRLHGGWLNPRIHAFMDRGRVAWMCAGKNSELHNLLKP